MNTFELSGQRDGYRIMLRTWDGGSGRPEYSFVAKLTNDEADCLVQAKYLLYNYDEDNEPTDTDPKTLMEIKPVDVLARFDTMPNHSPLLSNRLVITLPENEELGRKHTELVDPSHATVNHLMRWEEFKMKETES